MRIFRSAGRHALAAGVATSAVLLGAVLLGAGAGAAASTVSSDPAAAAAVQLAAIPHHATVRRGRVTHATLVVASGVSTVTVTTGRLGPDLAAASTPAASQLMPVLKVSHSGTVHARTRTAEGDGGPPSVLHLTLARSVVWRIRIVTGAKREHLDLRHARVPLVNFVAGVTKARLLLSARPGTQVVRDEGGATSLSIATPRKVAARVVVGGGASRLRLHGARYEGIARGRVFSTTGYGTARDRLHVVLVAGVSSIRIG